MPQDHIAIVLASSSPRRLELLSHLNVTFDIAIPDFEEVRTPGEAALAYVEKNAAGKAAAVVSERFRKASASPLPRSIVIAADTIVVLDGEVLEKPRDTDDAMRMLTKLSGQTHTVLTGLCMLMVARDGSIEKKRLAVHSSQVSFKTLEPAEIRAYIATGEPMDKAGSYAVQGKGSYMVAAINGSYTNVMGLPLTETYEWLRELAPTLFA